MRTLGRDCVIDKCNYKEKGRQMTWAVDRLRQKGGIQSKAAGTMSTMSTKSMGCEGVEGVGSLLSAREGNIMNITRRAVQQGQDRTG